VIAALLLIGRDAVAVTSNDVWQTFPIRSQSGTFDIEVDVTPGATNVDGVVGLSAGTVSEYEDLATIWRFNDGGLIDVRDGDAYRADASVCYTVGTTYHFRVAVDVSDHSYSVWVTPGGGAETALASNYGFRTAQANVASLSNWATRTAVDTMEVVGFTVSGGPGPGGDSDVVGGDNGSDYNGAIAAGCAVGEYYDLTAGACMQPEEKGCAAVGGAPLAALLLAVRRRR